LAARRPRGRSRREHSRRRSRWSLSPQHAGRAVTLHGLRKAAAVRLAEVGATVEQLMSVFGWRTPTMALYYCREAKKRKLNSEAFSLLESAA
jgi:hypothetical protein